MLARIYEKNQDKYFILCRLFESEYIHKIHRHIKQEQLNINNKAVLKRYEKECLTKHLNQ